MLKPNFAIFRLQTELESLELLPGAWINVNESEDGYASVIEYGMVISEGIYEGRTLSFLLKVPHGYPFKPPKLFCTDEVFHPNIDENGNVCMEILRLGWTPGYGLENILLNLHIIFLEVSGEDALNILAGDLFRSDYDRFVRLARGLEKLER